MHLKITYADVKGRAEPARLALVMGDIDFEDCRVSNEEFAVLKKKGDFPFGAVPTLTIDGKIYAQSNAILRYCGMQSGLYPSDPLLALKVDSVVDALEDVVNVMYPIGGPSKCDRVKLMEETIPRFFGAIDKMLGETDGPFLLGHDMTIADLKLYLLVENLTSSNVNSVPSDVMDKYSNVQLCIKTVVDNEKVSSWNAAHS